jgi:hypothetical protein
MADDADIQGRMLFQIWRIAVGLHVADKITASTSTDSIKLTLHRSWRVA